MLEKGTGPYFMKRILLLLSICASILFLSGCWDRVEVNDLAIVTGTAIDKSDDNQIEASPSKYLYRRALGSGGVVKLVEVEGENDIDNIPNREKYCRCSVKALRKTSS